MRDWSAGVGTEGCELASRESGGDGSGSGKKLGAEASGEFGHADHWQTPSDDEPAEGWTWVEPVRYDEAWLAEVKLTAGKKARTGRLYRKVDASGISGTGTVGWVIEFPDGSAVLRWCTEKPRSTAVYATLDDLQAIHGHGGFSVVIWDD